MVGRFAALLVALVMLVAGCANDREPETANSQPPAAASATTITAAPSAAVTTTPATITTAVATAAPGVAGTTSAVPARDRGACITRVHSGDSIAVVASRAQVDLAGFKQENGLSDQSVIHPDQELDICIDNDFDDVQGLSRLAPDSATVSAQQTKLNELFSDYSMLELPVDGDSGPMTRQAICAARLMLGLDPNLGHLDPNGTEAATIMAATQLQVPAGAPVGSSKWLLIDKTCQVIVAGEGADTIVDVYPTSTGEAGYETQATHAAAFRFDPALDNGGWHDSANYPVTIDNPLNGNMYKPIYFNGGQAIHGAEWVPPSPQSKGCARTFPWHQDRIIAWLGLGGLNEAIWSESTIGVTVLVQGEYRPLDT